MYNSSTSWGISSRLSSSQQNNYDEDDEDNDEEDDEPPASLSSASRVSQLAHPLPHRSKPRPVSTSITPSASSSIYASPGPAPSSSWGPDPPVIDSRQWGADPPASPRPQTPSSEFPRKPWGHQQLSTSSQSNWGMPPPSPTWNSLPPSGSSPPKSNSANGFHTSQPPISSSISSSFQPPPHISALHRSHTPVSEPWNDPPPSPSFSSSWQNNNGWGRGAGSANILGQTPPNATLPGWGSTPPIPISNNSVSRNSIIGGSYGMGGGMGGSLGTQGGGMAGESFASSFMTDFAEGPSSLSNSFVQPSLPPLESVSDGKWKVEYKLGQGSFGVVYAGTETSSGIQVAIKCEISAVPRPQLENEYCIYDILKGMEGIPKVYYYGTEGPYHVLVMERLGPTLKDLMRASPATRIPIRTIVYIIPQLIRRIQSIHAKGIVLRDVKPEQFCVGRAGDDITDRPTVFLIDFGLSGSYKDADGRHIRNPKPIKNAPRTGTARYASLNVHKGKMHSRRDDLESLIYTLIELALGKLPWTGIKAMSSIQGWRRIGIEKDDIIIADLTKDLPQQFGDALEYVRELKFAEEPDYEKLILWFTELLLKMDQEEEEEGKLGGKPPVEGRARKFLWEMDVTAAVMLWMLLVPICLFLYITLLLQPTIAPWALAYLIFVALDPAPEIGGRKWEWFRRLQYWKWFSGFFPVSIVKTAELDPSKTYLFGYHPHGIIAIGAFANFGTDATGFAKKFPGINVRLMTLQSNFHIPIWREILLTLGICSVSRRSCDNILSKGPGNSCMIVVGGAQESLNAFPYTYDLVIKKRLGFIKVALRNGANLVPVFSFGENDIWDQVPNPKGSYLRKFQQVFQKYASFSPPLFHGRGIFNYEFGILPYRRAITSVVGTPIECPKIPNPTEAEILEYQKKYLDGLQEIYDKYKDQYAPNRKRDLCFVE
ncbi:diacylglycerol O-acyltransferase 1 [Chytridiales sp. JEL 0842]|nr:diacylglycerol O-acyltransferase 1 [Chytridiales sp. JEL 0842]